MRLLFLILVSVVSTSIVAQPLPDSVKIIYANAKTDAEKGECLKEYLSTFIDGKQLIDEALMLYSYFTTNNDEVGKDYVQLSMGRILAITGDYTNALSQSLQILKRFEDRKDTYGIILANNGVAEAFYYAGDFRKAIRYYKMSIPLILENGNKKLLSSVYNNIGTSYQQINLPDSGLFYGKQAVKYAEEIQDAGSFSVALGTLGENYISKKEYTTAIPLIKKSYAISHSIKDFNTDCWNLNDLAQIFLEINQHDSARYYARLAIALANEWSYKDQTLRAYSYMYKSFEETDTRDSVYKYFRLATTTKDSLFSAQNAKEIQNINFREQIRKQEVEQGIVEWQNKIRTYSLLAGLFTFSIIASVLYRNNKQKLKINSELNETLTNLKATQSQLIQSEKMASLGELTAGIAHEIQNPLNFVNNFSEVNTELIDELEQEVYKGNLEEVKLLTKDIKENEKKINHHGKRAGDIVKGMLQHSRSSSGLKEPTDINVLADEYLRLAYHGVRAKDKSFNAELKTDFDSSITAINIIPQDIGRVLLNLITNAFYAVNEKTKQNNSGYEPIVSVSTKKEDNKVLISVKDNGNGIPQEIKEKIFQPFFTTKPTGQGTGLGLSMSYDFVKAHGGELKVETKEREGSEFIIKLPIV